MAEIVSLLPSSPYCFLLVLQDTQGALFVQTSFFNVPN